LHHNLIKRGNKMANTKTQNATANKAASTPAKALSAKAIKAQEAKSAAIAAKFFAEQEAAKVTTLAPTSLVHPEVIKTSPFAALEQPARAAVKTEPVKRTPLLVQNGMQKPGAGTIGCRMWDVMDAYSKTLGRAVTRAELSAAPEFKDDLVVNVSSIYARWRKFNGIVGRTSAPKQAQGQDAGLTPL
jgi:hypothetical protein